MSPTVVIKSAHLPSFGLRGDLYSIKEHPVDDIELRTERPSSRSSVTRPSTAGSAYPMYPGLQTPSSDRNGFTDSPPPMMLNRPRKLSKNTGPAKPTTSILDRPRSSFKLPPLNTRLQQESTEFNSRKASRMYAQPSPTAQSPTTRRRRLATDRTIVSLPGEVMELILEHLRCLHLCRGSHSCATCWMRDLCSLCLSSRKWYKFSRAALYNDIQLSGSDSTVQKKRFKLHQGSRLVLLRRTLRDNSQIASLVRILKVPIPDAITIASGDKSMPGIEQYENRVASVVMACPNLEKLVGPFSTYDHSFKRLFHALSTRKHLKEMNWEVEAADTDELPRSDSPFQDDSDGKIAELRHSQGKSFLDHHRNWSSLKRLTVHCLPGATIGSSALFSKTVLALPALQDLYLCNLPSVAFNNENLLQLPRLRTLSLLNITGITSSGLSSFATLPNSQSLQNLDLRHTPMASLAALARVFSNLASLKSFSLVQNFSPLMPEADSFMLWMMPYLASTSIEALHWDIMSHENCASPADQILAKSVAAGGFPALKQLRAPYDPEGVFQALCRPVEQISLPSDPFRRASASEAKPSSTPSSPAKALKKSVTASSLPTTTSKTAPMGSDLVEARLAAQKRLENSRSETKFHVNVRDHDGDLVDAFGLGSFIGTVGSEINYHLLPDDDAGDENGGLVDICNLRDDADEKMLGERDGCTGRWNWSDSGVADRKEKERWWHTERGRWTEVKLR